MPGSKADPIRNRGIKVFHVGFLQSAFIATGASGTALDLVMVTRGVDFKTALEWLAQRAGITPGTTSLPPPAPRTRPPPTARSIRPTVVLGSPVDFVHLAPKLSE